MRQIGTLKDGDAAKKLADYLLTLKIETRLEQQPDGWIVWVCDEDRVAEAREQFFDFTENPQDSRFAGAAKAAHELRLRELEEDEDYRQRMTDFRQRMTEPTAHPRYVTAFLLLTAVLVSLATDFGQPKDGYQRVVRDLMVISTQSNLRQIAGGEVYRLITPIFLHFDHVHLLFNCLIVVSLAGQIERLQGSLRLIWLVVLFAVLSNLAQYYLGHPYDPQVGFIWQRNPNFGGLSGVAYGFFSYVWMKTRYEPDLGFHMTSLTVTIMLFWFVACLTGLLGPIANAAHAAGLILGLAVGAAPHLWRSFRKP